MVGKSLCSSTFHIVVLFSCYERSKRGYKVFFDGGRGRKTPTYNCTDNLYVSGHDRRLNVMQHIPLI